MLRSFFIFFCLCFNAALYAQDDVIFTDSSLLQNDEIIPYEEPFSEEDQEAELIPDTSFVLKPVIISGDSIERIRSAKEFGYVKNLDSLLKAQKKDDAENIRIARRSMSLIDRIFNASWLQVILWLIVAAVVIFILVKLFATSGIFSRTVRKPDVEEAEEEVEPSLQGDHSSLIAEYAARKDYRSATKYLFLRSLQMLSERSLINFAPDKTNDQYMRELPAYLKSGFRKISMRYEYIWYGKKYINEQQYNTVLEEFSMFDKSI